jgi:hypothetical protein
MVKAHLHLGEVTSGRGNAGMAAEASKMAHDSAAATFDAALVSPDVCLA